MASWRKLLTEWAEIPPREYEQQANSESTLRFVNNSFTLEAIAALPSVEWETLKPLTRLFERGGEGKMNRKFPRSVMTAASLAQNANIPSTIAFTILFALETIFWATPPDVCQAEQRRTFASCRRDATFLLGTDDRVDYLVSVKHTGSSIEDGYDVDGATVITLFQLNPLLTDPSIRVFQFRANDNGTSFAEIYQTQSHTADAVFALMERLYYHYREMPNAQLTAAKLVGVVDDVIANDLATEGHRAAWLVSSMLLLKEEQRGFSRLFETLGQTAEAWLSRVYDDIDRSSNYTHPAKVLQVLRLRNAMRRAARPMFAHASIIFPQWLDNLMTLYWEPHIADSWTRWERASRTSAEEEARRDRERRQFYDQSPYVSSDDDDDAPSSFVFPPPRPFVPPVKIEKTEPNDDDDNNTQLDWTPVEQVRRRRRVGDDVKTETSD